MTSIYNQLKLEYEQKRLNNYHIRQERLALVYEKVPQIEAIDTQIKQAGIKYNMHILSKPDDTKSITKLKHCIASLDEKKRALLSDNGFEYTFLDEIYDCPLCKDRGIIQDEFSSRICHCFQQKYINLVFGQCNLSIIDKENFSTFDENYYSDTVDIQKYNSNNSPRQNILNIKSAALKFIEDFDNPDTKNLLFIGNTGVGKTFMLNCIAFELLRKCKSVIYKTSSQLFDIINKYKLQALSDPSFNFEDYQQIFSVDLLIIDDLGTEPQSNSKYSELLNILNQRKLNNLKTVASTNINLSLISEIYSERVLSRIIEDFNILRFFGHDIRAVKRKKEL
ncbi:MAG: ATP-binding protein [Clostridiales bacterium]|nr:ATP-binding protein [Clostridiales bacterium]